MLLRPAILPTLCAVVPGYSIYCTVCAMPQDVHLAHCRAFLSSRARSLCDAITLHLCGPEVGCTFVAPTGGYFVWVRLPEGVSVEEVAKVRGAFPVSSEVSTPSTSHLPTRHIVKDPLPTCHIVRSILSQQVT